MPSSKGEGKIQVDMVMFNHVQVGRRPSDSTCREVMNLTGHSAMPDAPLLAATMMPCFARCDKQPVGFEELVITRLHLRNITQCQTTGNGSQKNKRKRLENQTGQG
jgi:hypothetical protein